MKTFLRALATILVLATSLSLALPVVADVTELDNTKLNELIASGVPVIDVRREDEWLKTGVIKGAHKLTFFDRQGRYDAAKWLQSLDAIVAKNEPFVLICAAGVRSKVISKLLDKRLGYSGVHNHTRGMNDWLKKGLPVEPHKKASTNKPVKN